MKYLILFSLLLVMGCGITSEETQGIHDWNLQNYPGRIVAVEMEKQNKLLERIIVILEQNSLAPKE